VGKIEGRPSALSRLETEGILGRKFAGGKKTNHGRKKGKQSSSENRWRKGAEDRLLVAKSPGTQERGERLIKKKGGKDREKEGGSERSTYESPGPHLLQARGGERKGERGGGSPFEIEARASRGRKVNSCRKWGQGRGGGPPNGGGVLDGKITGKVQ